MSFGDVYIPLLGVNTDLAPSKLPKNMATFIKNLTYAIQDTADGGKSAGADTGIFKTMQSNQRYISDLTLPDGDNYCIGALSSRETKQVFAWIYNSNKNHTVYVLNGETQTLDIMLRGSYLNLQLNPENFIHVGDAALQILYITDPDTGEKKRKTFITWCDNYNPNRFTCVEDAIATGGFNKNLIGYFSGNYDFENWINVGVAPDQDCIGIEEVPVTEESEQKNNTMLFKTWQFRTRWYDVWGRPSDYSIISDAYIPGLNDCLSSSANIARCIDLSFNTPPPNINKVEIAYRNCNDLQWYTSDTLELFNGSNLGNWWERQRNPDINYSADGSKIIYRFCADHECQPISPAVTTRLFNPVPNKSVGVAQLGKTFGYYNNEYGNNPIPKSTLDKIKKSVILPDSTTGEIQSRNITIYIPVYNAYLNNFQQVFKDGELGYSWGDNSSRHGGARAYQQYFANTDQSGFVGYLVGSGSSVSTQVYVVGSNELVDDVDHNGKELSQLKYNGGGYTMQKFVFSNVPSGIYIFRLSSHLSNPSTDVDFRKTSTTLWGTFPLRPNSLIPDISDIGQANNTPRSQELFIDVCNSDYNTLSSGEMLVIADVAAFAGTFVGGERRSLASYGYIYESSENKIPVELLGYGQFFSSLTDHNGFYWMSVFVPTNIIGFPIHFSFINKCSAVIVTRAYQTPNIIREDLYMDSIGGSAYSDYSITPCNRIEIHGRLVLNGTNIGIPGVTLVLTRGQTAVTDVNGFFTIICHDDVYNNPRKDSIVITNGACRYYIEGSNCLAPVPVIIYRCNNCTERIIDFGETFLLSTFLQHGLLSGGTYAIGISGKDYEDRSTFVQDLGYINIPTVQETKVFSPSKIQITFDNSISFPKDLKTLVFNVSDETTTSSYVTWIVDAFEFVDNTGNVNNTNPTQIKIYYGSLIEYNKQNNYNTTVEWGFIQEGTVDQPVTTDNVTFLVNGDGKFFDRSITSRVKYAVDGKYFLIDYTEELKDLKPNALIRLFRPKECITSEFMYERCMVIHLKDGKPDVLSFTLDAFDTYYISREIPVPVPQADSEGTALETRIFAYPFEHDSPSDLWGKGCNNRGRVNVKNPYESVIYLQDEITLSGSFSDNGYLNYLNVFEDGYSAGGVTVPSRRTNFDKSNLNGITSIIPQIGIIMLIGQHNNATVGFNDNLLRGNKDGSISLPSAQDTFGQPNVNPLANFGCLLFDKNSIAEYDGMVHWVDSSNAALIQHDYRNAKNISMLSCDAYFRAKVKAVQNYNTSNPRRRYFTGVTNPVNKEYIVTDKIIGDVSYFNDLREKDVSVQETLTFDIYSKMFKGWRSDTPEYYSSLKGERNDQQLFSFKNGIPYFYFTAISDDINYGTFFDIPAERVIEIVVNVDEIKKKGGLFASSYSHSLYWADRIITEANQESWIPVSFWKQGDFFWSAPLLCDINTPTDPNRPLIDTLTEGNMLYGLWMKIRFVGALEDNTKYTELTGFTVDVMPKEKSGI